MMQSRRLVKCLSSSVLSTRALSSTTKRTKIPSNEQIIHAFRSGDFANAVSNFARRPAHLRSPSLYEAAISGCAQIPDAAAAQAVLNAMHTPTPSAVTSVVTAWCREQNVSAAADVLHYAKRSGIDVDPAVVVYVSRFAHRVNRPDIVLRLNDLRPSAAGAENRSKKPAAFDDLAEKDEQIERDEALTGVKYSSRSALAVPKRSDHLLHDAATAERRLQASGPRVQDVYNEWRSISEDQSLRREVGVICAAVSTLASCSGTRGGSLAINTLMTWIRSELYDPSTQRGNPFYTNRPSAMALLLTATTSALAAAATETPRLALSAYDALNSLRLPGFSRSLPLTGAYLKVLQNAHLPLSSTHERINRVWAQHIQFDEQAFSMALGALLKSQASVADKLRAARDWVSNAMRASGIPLTVHTYNLLAGQVRYAGDARLVSDLLSDMRDAGVQPTAVTYGLVFGVCTMHGEYTQRDRRQELPVALWLRVLSGMREHMARAGVKHTAYSRLSLAKSYAHLGEVGLAAKEFDEFLVFHKATAAGGPDFDGVEPGDDDNNDNDNNNNIDNDNDENGERFENAFYHVMHHIAHARECSSASVTAILSLCEKMRQYGMVARASALNALTVASVRAGRMVDMADILSDWIETPAVSEGMNITGMKHLLQAIGYAPNAKAWFDGGLRDILLTYNIGVLRRDELASSVRSVVLQFARAGHRNVCEDIVRTVGVSMQDLNNVYKGREFLSLRGHEKHQLNGE